MRALLVTYAIILLLGMASLFSGIHYFANIAGFISAIGFLLVFFKDRPDEESAQQIKLRRYWYLVFATGVFFSLLLGSLWNDQMGGMAPN
jgi:heme A synthase